MKIEETITEDGYIGKIIYMNEYSHLTPSKRYILKIEKDGKTYINRSGLTCSGAKTLFFRWINKKKLKHNLKIKSSNSN